MSARDRGTEGRQGEKEKRERESGRARERESGRARERESERARAREREGERARIIPVHGWFNCRLWLEAVKHPLCLWSVRFHL